MQALELRLFADYHQFYFQDLHAPGDLSRAWTPEASDRLLATAPGVVGVGTVRDMMVPVRLELHGAELHGAEPDGDADAWDHAVECSLAVTSGRIAILGCTDYFPDAAQVEVPVGNLCVRVSYAGLDTLSRDGLDGDDRYRVQLWPGPPGPIRVIKQRLVQPG